MVMEVRDRARLLRWTSEAVVPTWAGVVACFHWLPVEYLVKEKQLGFGRSA